ncbi:hypothetical protein ARMGADRAFT_758305 [Armillaria gallica]|uniref:Uncharacterized protein n=1 Tax=Armillaria gallica TaxID=47427 RepID=A0A2H3DLL6_ARMGA|nr:hypothetical protein ARMGADRAFT_758305 [Armillaria gallica]
MAELYRESNDVYCTQTLRDFYLSLGTYVPTDNDRTSISDLPSWYSKSKGAPMTRPAELESERQSRGKLQLHAPLTQETSLAHLSESSTLRSHSRSETRSCRSSSTHIRGGDWSSEYDNKPSRGRRLSYSEKMNGLCYEQAVESPWWEECGKMERKWLRQHRLPVRCLPAGN